MNGSCPAPGRRLRWLALAGAVAGLVAVAGCGSGAAGPAVPVTRAQNAAQQAAAANPDLDTGTSVGGSAAPRFRLVNQFGQRVSLSAFRGKVVILAFTDSQCTTICPLTTVSMLEARQLLGRAGDQVQLLGVNANPKATAVSDVMGYSRSHSMVNQWDFLTGSLPQLRAVWRAYHVYVQIQAGQIDHTPALYVIDQQGRERKLYLTTMAYASVGQAAQILAQEVSSLLPGHPKLASQRSLAYIRGLSPKSRSVLPAVPSGSVTLGPGRPHLVMFFATWLRQTSDLAARLTGLNVYARAARRGRAAGAGRGRRGDHRAICRRRANLPRAPEPAAAVSGCARHHRQAGRRLRSPGPALVRADLRHRKDPLEARRVAPGIRPGGRRPPGLTGHPTISPWRARELAGMANMYLEPGSQSLHE